MGTPSTPVTRPAGLARSKTLFIIPALLCVCVLAHKFQVSLQHSIHHGAEADAAAHAELRQQLNTTRSSLKSSNEQVVSLMGEVTALKQKLDSQQQQLGQLKQKDEQIKQRDEQLKQKDQELQGAQKQVQEKEQQLQKQAEQLKQQPKQQQQQGAAAPLTDAAVVTSRLHVLEVAGLQCNPVVDQEFWADPLIFGYEHRAQDAGECCAACHAYNAAAERGGTDRGRNATRCNVWAFCADKEHCKTRLGECWVKHQKLPLPPPPALPPDAHAVKGWVSGAIYPDETLLLKGKKNPPHAQLMMHTTLGDIAIKLLPDLAPASVRELARAAKLQAEGLTQCSNCRIYRPEPGFLVQGLLEAPGAYVAVPRHPNPKQPMMMPRGMVCWAGGTGGPHWFVNLINQTGFKDDHLCWGQVQDMALFDKIADLPKRPKKPGDMNALVDHIRYNITLKTE